MGWINVAKAACPSCGARIEIERSRDHAKCEYCGTMSAVAQRGAPPPAVPTVGPRIEIASARQARFIALAIAVSVLVTLGMAAFRISMAVSSAADRFGDAMGGVSGALDSMGGNAKPD